MRNTLYILLLLLYPISCLQAGGGTGSRGSREEKPEGRKVVVMRTLANKTPKDEKAEDEELSAAELEKMIFQTVLCPSLIEARIERAGNLMNFW